MTMLGNSGLFVGGTILLLTSYTFAANEEDIHEITTMSLIFLKAHEDRVIAHEAKELDENVKKNFILTWSDLLDETMAMDIFNLIEMDWRYTLDLANSNDNDITALVLALFNKIEAFTQMWYYDSCLEYFSLLSESDYKPEHCRKLSAYLSIHSIKGTDELIRKFLSIAGSSLSEDHKRSIQKHLNNVAKLEMDMFKKSLKPGNATSEIFGILLKLAKSIAFASLLHTADTDDSNHFKQMEKLKMSIMFGHLEKEIREEKVAPFAFCAHYLKTLWDNSKDLIMRPSSSKNAIDNSPDLEMKKSSITEIMREILIQKAEILGVNSRNEFESIKQANVKISLNEGEFTKTVD